MRVQAIAGAMFLGVAGLVLLASPPIPKAAAQNASCYQPLCTDSVDNTYQPGQDGTNRGGPFGVCANQPVFLGPSSHQLDNCPAGTTLVPNAGLCRANSCTGGGSSSCEERGLCTDAAYPYYLQGSDDPGRQSAACGTAPQFFTNALAHVVTACPAGFTLVGGVGVCRRCSSMTTTTATTTTTRTITTATVSTNTLIRPPGGPIVLRLPDLVIRAAWLQTRTSPVHVTTLKRGTPYYACFTVANIGSGASGVFRVSGGGLGVPAAPFQDQAGLAASATRTGCLAYPTTPQPGSYQLGLTADSQHAVAEGREDNNDAVIPVTVVP